MSSSTKVVLRIAFKNSLNENLKYVQTNSNCTFVLQIVSLEEKFSYPATGMVWMSSLTKAVLPIPFKNILNVVEDIKAIWKCWCFRVSPNPSKF